MTSDVLGLNQVLLRRDAEKYTSFSWTPDGSGVLVGNSHGSWQVGMDGKRVALGVSIASLSPITGSLDGTSVVMSDNPTTRLVTLDYSTGDVQATRYLGAEPEAGAVEVQLQVPYIQQVNDTQGETATGRAAPLPWRWCWPTTGELCPGLPTSKSAWQATCRPPPPKGL